MPFCHSLNKHLDCTPDYGCIEISYAQYNKCYDAGHKVTFFKTCSVDPSKPYARKNQKKAKIAAPSWPTVKTILNYASVKIDPNLDISPDPQVPSPKPLAPKPRTLSSLGSSPSSPIIIPYSGSRIVIPCSPSDSDSSLSIVDLTSEESSGADIDYSLLADDSDVSAIEPSSPLILSESECSLATTLPPESHSITEEKTYPETENPAEDENLFGDIIAFNQFLLDTFPFPLHDEEPDSTISQNLLNSDSIAFQDLPAPSTSSFLDSSDSNLEIAPNGSPISIFDFDPDCPQKRKHSELDEEEEEEEEPIDWSQLHAEIYSSSEYRACLKRSTFDLEDYLSYCNEQVIY